MKRILIVMSVLAVFALISSACMPAESNDVSSSERRNCVSVSGTAIIVCEIELRSGTECAVATWPGQSNVSISCDWGNE